VATGSKHPSFDSDKEGHHYVPGRARGNADYFAKEIPPVRDAATGHPIGSDGRIDWAAVIREVNERDRGNA
jgi:hypothetical protein